MIKSANASWKNIYMEIEGKEAPRSIAPIPLLKDYY